MTRDPDCIFCRIVNGEVPCYKLYEDDQVLAFLDVGPLSRGHSLIIPKAHYRTLAEMPGDLAAACARVAPRLSRAIMAATGKSASNLLQNNGRIAHQAVEHVHFHIIPKYDAESGLGIHWPAGKLDDDEAKPLVEAITTAMN